MLQILPYIPPPTSLTAKHAPQCLEEHLLAFLAANNRSGFDAEASTVAESEFMVRLQELRGRESMSEENFKRFAWKLKKLTTGAVKHGHVLEVCARALGYNTYAALHTNRRWNHEEQRWYINNRETHEQQDD